MSLSLRIPRQDQGTIVENDQMVRAAKLTLSALRSGGLVVWTGKARIGKTVTAKWLANAANKEFNSADAETFRALHFETGEIRRNSGSQQKQAVRSLYSQVIGAPLTDFAYRRSPPEDLAEQVVRGLMRNSQRLVLVDEAGLLGVDAIGGYVLVRDIAENLSWPTSIVFIGMDDLAETIETREQIKARVHEWCYFQPYDESQTKRLLSALHPHFSSAAWPRHLHEEAEFIRTQCAGLPGEMIKFLRQVDARLVELDLPFDMDLLCVVRDLVVLDKENCLADAKAGYKVRHIGVAR